MMRIFCHVYRQSWFCLIEQTKWLHKLESTSHVKEALTEKRNINIHVGNMGIRHWENEREKSFCCSVIQQAQEIQNFKKSNIFKVHTLLLMGKGNSDTILHLFLFYVSQMTRWPSMRSEIWWSLFTVILGQNLVLEKYQTT